MMKVGILASGNLGLHTIKMCIDIVKPLFIATDKGSDGIIFFAKEQHIPIFIGNPRNGKLRLFIKEHKFDIIFSINYLFLIKKDIIQLAKYPINFHGSLLPKYRGRTPHVWSIINNETNTGITAHIIDENCDTGDVVLQKEIPIKANDTGAIILEQYNDLYPSMVKEVLNLVVNDKLQLTPQNNNVASYFGKRTPEDGLIKWFWQKERIRNWVRAQAFPYPGAFAMIEGEKIVIDKIDFLEHTFDYEMPDGLILQDSPKILVKTSNGVIELKSIRTNINLCKKGKIFEYEN